MFFVIQVPGNLSSGFFLKMKIRIETQESLGQEYPSRYIYDHRIRCFLYVTLASYCSLPIRYSCVTLLMRCWKTAKKEKAIGMWVLENMPSARDDSWSRLCFHCVQPRMCKKWLSKFKKIVQKSQKVVIFPNAYFCHLSWRTVEPTPLTAVSSTCSRRSVATATTTGSEIRHSLARMSSPHSIASLFNCPGSGWSQLPNCLSRRLSSITSQSDTQQRFKG